MKKRSHSPIHIISFDETQALILMYCVYLLFLISLDRKVCARQLNYNKNIELSDVIIMATTKVKFTPIDAFECYISA